MGFSPAEITLQNWSDTTDLELFAKAAFLVFWLVSCNFIPNILDQRVFTYNS